MSKTCFINVGIGQWYCTGSERLNGSLVQHGFPGDRLIWVNEWPSGSFPRDVVYNCKADAFEQALKRGYTTIIWGDSSITALGDMRVFVEEVRTKGYWIGQSGYRASQTASDAQLRHFGVDRDWAHGIPDCATGLFGVNVEHDRPRQFIETWIRAGREGAFRGARTHAGQSQDPRYLHCRQDQSAASIILGQLGMELGSFQDYCAFKWDKREGKTFLCEGM